MGQFGRGKGQVFIGEILRGKIINLNEGEPERDPIAKPDKHPDLGQPPNAALTEGFDKEDLELGDRVKFRVYNAESSILFGEAVPEEKRDSEPEEEGDFQVVFYIAGNRFTSDNMPNQQQAESVVDVLEHLHEITGEVERTR